MPDPRAPSIRETQIMPCKNRFFFWPCMGTGPLTCQKYLTLTARLQVASDGMSAAGLTRIPALNMDFYSNTQTRPNLIRFLGVAFCSKFPIFIQADATDLFKKIPRALAASSCGSFCEGESGTWNNPHKRLCLCRKQSPAEVVAYYTYKVFSGVVLVFNLDFREY